MSMGHMSRWVAIGFCVLSSWQGYATEAAGTQYQLNVPAQSVYDALKAFAAQTSLQVVYYSDVAQGAASPGVSGELEAGVALNRILAGTGLTYQFLNERTVAIRGAKEVAAVGAVTPTESSRGDGVRLAQAERGSSDSNAAESTQISTGPADSASPAESLEGVKLEEVVVTAQKRVERLQDVPMSISVLSAESIEKRSLVSANDFLKYVPGVAYEEVSAGQNTFRIRGIGGSVGTYLGDMPIPATSDLKLVDVERVEVLRGPQGTLYGAGSMGGTIRYIPKLPDATQSARCRAKSQRASTASARLPKQDSELQSDGGSRAEARDCRSVSALP
jgi:iron complex outermembrane recepter protein